MGSYGLTFSKAQNIAGPFRFIVFQINQGDLWNVHCFISLVILFHTGSGIDTLSLFAISCFNPALVSLMGPIPTRKKGL